MDDAHAAVERTEVNAILALTEARARESDDCGLGRSHCPLYTSSLNFDRTVNPAVGIVMPHTSSAKKRLRQTQKRRTRNRGVMKAIKVQLKRFAAAVNGPIEALRKEYDLAAKKLDKAA